MSSLPIPVVSRDSLREKKAARLSDRAARTAASSLDLAPASPFEVVRVIVAGIEHRAHLLDISSSGARLHAALTILPGERFLLSVADETIQAEVIWADAQRIGVWFVSRPSNEMLERICGTSGVGPLQLAGGT